MRICVLGSGSSGNAAVVSHDGTHLLVDAGLSAAQLRTRLALAGLRPEELTAILLTHEHGDHTRGLDMFTRQLDAPIFCTALTREILRDSCKEQKHWKILPPAQPVPIGAVCVEAFSVPHDAVDPVGFVFRGAQAALGFLSDAGHVTPVIRSRLAGMNTLFLEANYDGTMLQNDTKRPWSTKQRIMSRHGHLSNHQTAELVTTLAHSGLEKIVLGHMSQDCNTPELAAASVRAALESTCACSGENTRSASPVQVHCASPHEPTAWITVRDRPPPPPEETNSPNRPHSPAWSSQVVYVQGELL
jgi:phosphoribosyl 1,2-cyclic phosphodiesterase